jgi:hypothetical protein
MVFWCFGAFVFLVDDKCGGVGREGARGVRVLLANPQVGAAVCKVPGGIGSGESGS